MSQTIVASGYTLTQNYGYDAVNRLKIAVEGAAVPGSMTCLVTTSWCQEYNYDHFGNRWVTSNLSLHLATPTSSAAFNATTNRLTAASYDNAGNMTAHPFITPSGSIGYDANNLATQFTATGITASYGYDAQGRRVRVTHNGVTTIQVYDAMGRLAVEYSTQAPAQTNGVYYQTTDNLGSTRIVTDSAGQVKLRRDFFPFGEEIPASASYGNRHQVLDNGIATYNAWSGIPQQFTGQQRDSTGLDYFWARNYFGPSGRFLSVDPGNAGASMGNPQGWNAYAYVLNNPLFLVDRNGLDPSCVHLVCVDVTGRPYGDSSGTTSVILIYPNPPGSVPPEGRIEEGDCPWACDTPVGNRVAMISAHNPNLGAQIRGKLVQRAANVVRRMAGRGRVATLGTAGFAITVAGSVLDANALGGLLGELVVHSLLESLGFEVLGSNVTIHTAWGDRRPDFLVRDPHNGTLFAIEVKTRLESFSPSTWSQLAKDYLIATEGGTIGSDVGFERHSPGHPNCVDDFLTMAQIESAQQVLLKHIEDRVARFGYRRKRDRFVRVPTEGTTLVLFANVRLRPFGLYVYTGVGIRFDEVEALKHEVDPDLSPNLKRRTLTLGSHFDRLLGESPLFWKGADEADIPAIGESILRDFDSVGLPYLRQYSNPKEALEGLLDDDEAKACKLHLSVQYRIMNALAITFLLGDRKRYERVLADKTSLVEHHPNTALRYFHAFVASMEGKWKERLSKQTANEA